VRERAPSGLQMPLCEEDAAPDVVAGAKSCGSEVSDAELRSRSRSPREGPPRHGLLGSAENAAGLRGTGCGEREIASRPEVRESARSGVEAGLFLEINRKFTLEIVRAADGALLLTAFVDAVEQFLSVLDSLGAAVAEIVKMDMRQNLRKIARASEKYCAESMQTLVECEVKDGLERDSSSGTEALLWLKRTLQFILRLLFRIAHEPSETLSLSQSALEAYDSTLRSCHNWILVQMFHGALLCLPSRERFFSSLGPSEPSVRTDMARFVLIFGPILRVVEEHYLHAGLEQVCLIRMADFCASAPDPTSFAC